MNKNFAWLTALAFSLFIGQAAYAEGQEQPAEKPCGCGGHLKQMVESLKLDDVQQAKIKAVKEQLVANEGSLLQQIKTIRTQINQLIQADSFDQATIDSLIEKKKELMGSMMKAKILAKHEIYVVLNPQQKAQYQQLVEQWEEHPVMSN